VVHAMRNGSDAELTIWWVYGGASSLESAGLETVDLPMPP
jgi:hypothetical protein